jgi:ABC-type nitrate/sulfonate/bicarbonate transport system permease component
MIKGEMFIALVGLGALLRKYGSRFDSARVFAILLVVIGVALLCSAAVRVFERRFTVWAEEGA